VLEWGSELRKNNPEQTNIHPLIASYLAAYPKCLYTEYDPEKPGKNYAVDPRAWEQVSDIIYDNNGELWQELIENKIGEANATSLLAFADKNFITLEDILEENYDEEDIPARLDEQYALALTLRYTKEKDIAKVREFISNNLSGETLAKFDFVWANNDPERLMILNDLMSGKSSQEAEGVSEKKDYKIHIVDFCGTEDWRDRWSKIKDEDRKAIKCNNIEQAQYLWKAFKKLNKTLSSGDHFDDKKYFAPDCCYTNWGMYVINNYLHKEHYPIYDFFDVDFAGVLPKEDIRAIDIMRSKEILAKETESEDQEVVC
jgi:hypothetical protein